MTPDELTALVRADLAAACAPPVPAHPWCAGAVALAGAGGEVLLHEAAGHALRYAAWDERAGAPVELPPEERLPVRPDTLFDLASVTKLFTAIALLQQAERGVIGLDARAARYLPEFGAAGKQNVTVRQLLTHTAGLPAELPFYDCGSAAERLRLLWEQPLLTPPGETFRYSDPGLITLGLLLERVTGTALDLLVGEGIAAPLGMASTRFAPPPADRSRIAATEDQRRPWGRLDRGLVHGEAHDENAHAFGGVAGHAGLFADAADLGRLCQALLAGGAGILRPETVALMTRDHGVPGHPRGLGFDLGQPSFMGELAGPRAAGHSGFTGTSLVVDFATGAWVVLLANSVHPIRARRPGHGPRPSVATRVAGYVRAARERPA